MRNLILAGLALTALAASPAAAAPSPALMLDGKASVLAAAASAAQSGGVRVWVDSHRDYYRYTDRLRIRVRSENDGYLAVFHIDTNGDVDILYPRSESDDGWVERGRTLTLGSRRSDYLNVRGGNGVGYVMAVALEEPLELWRVRDLYRPRFAGWDSDRSIYGDPFYAMDEIVRAVVPESMYGYESVDYYTYHMGGRYDYPRYACYDGYGDWYHDSRYSYYGRSRCDRVRVILVNRPWYYDTYRWRGSRRVYYDRYYYRTARSRPLHGYKERTQSQAPPARSSAAQRRPGASGTSGTPALRGGVNSTRPESTRPAREGAVSAQRPERDGGRNGPAVARRPETTERTAPSTRPERGTYEPRVRDRGEGRGVEPRVNTRPEGGARPEQTAQPQQDKPVEPSRERPTFQRRPSGGERQAEPRRESPPARSAEPRRESPPSRSAEPRRESPPARSAEPRRSSPPSRSAEPRRESAPSREASPPSRDGGGGSGGSRGGGRGTRPG